MISKPTKSSTKRRFANQCHIVTLQCAEQAQLPHDALLKCYLSDVGVRLQLEAEEKTKQLASPRPLLAFVPTIVYNHVNILANLPTFFVRKNKQQEIKGNNLVHWHQINWLSRMHFSAPDIRCGQAGAFIVRVPKGGVRGDPANIGPSSGYLCTSLGLQRPRSSQGL